MKHRRVQAKYVTGSLFPIDLPELERKLDTQLGRVWDVTRGGRWRTLTEIQDAIRRRYGKLDSEAGISARLRDLRNQHGLRIAVRIRSGNTREYSVAGPSQRAPTTGGSR